MTSTNIAVVMRRGVTRATAFLDPALPLEAKLSFRNRSTPTEPPPVEPLAPLVPSDQPLSSPSLLRTAPSVGGVPRESVKRSTMPSGSIRQTIASTTRGFQ